MSKFDVYLNHLNIMVFQVQYQVFVLCLEDAVYFIVYSTFIFLLFINVINLTVSFLLNILNFKDQK